MDHRGSTVSRARFASRPTKVLIKRWLPPREPRTSTETSAHLLELLPLGLSRVVPAIQSAYRSPIQPDTEPIMATLRSVLHVVKSRVQAGRVICPVCASTYCRRSARHGYRDLLRRLAGRFPWRCNLCGGRFYLRKRFVDEGPLVEDYASHAKHSI